MLQVIYKNGVCFFRVIQVCIPGFLREGNGIQPVKQFQIHAGSAVGVLGGMKMQVSKSWNDQAVAHVFYRNALIFLWKLGKNAGTEAVFTDYIRIFVENKLFLVLAVTDRTLQSKQIFLHIKPSFLREVRRSVNPGNWGRESTAGKTGNRFSGNSAIKKPPENATPAPLFVCSL